MVLEADTGWPHLSVKQKLLSGRAGSIPVYHPQLVITMNTRPIWCPYTTCQYIKQFQDCICVGRLPQKTEHDGDFNTHRLCISNSCENDVPFVFDLEVNKNDAYLLSRLLKIVVDNV